MYITTDYLGINQGGVRFLFFLLTEDYIEENKTIQSSLAPLFRRFGQQLAAAGAIIKPASGAASENFTKILNAHESESFKWSLNGKTPAILVIEGDLKTFRPSHSKHMVISLRDSMDSFGNVKIFEVGELLQALAEASHEGTVFTQAGKVLAERNRKVRNDALAESVQFKPNFFGIGLDLRQAIAAFKKK